MDRSTSNKNGSPFNNLSKAYDAWFERDGKYIFAIEVKAFQTILTQLPEPWLEIGVGSGRFAQALGIKTGIDPSIKLLDMAKARGIDVYQARGEDNIFDETTFGTVFFITTLCFVSSPLNALSEAHRILKENGKVALGLILRDSPWGQLYLKKKEMGHQFYKHATVYSYQEVTGLLNQAGFIIEKIVSTLFQRPGEVVEIESPREYFSPAAGFTIIVARKLSG
jgi:SAM-dependent methyltransferase